MNRLATHRCISAALGFAMLLLIAFWLTPSAAVQAVVPRIALSSPFALPGTALSVTLTGSPGAAIKLYASAQPAEIDLGAVGLQFYKSGTQSLLASGTLGSDGSLTVSLPIASTAPSGSVVYLQAQSQLSGQKLLSNGLAYRVQSALPSGARKTTSMALTPDGTRAYVVDQLSGVVTVLDAVNDRKLADLPITLASGTTPHRPVRVAVDPEGRHAFVANAVASTLAVIHTATGSVAAQIPVPRGSRGLGFDFRNGQRRIYVANETRNAVLVFQEAPLGTFTAQGSIPLQSTAPGPLLVLPDGKLAVGTRTQDQIEVLDPSAPAGATTLALTPTAGPPFELAWSGSEILVSTFIALGQDRTPGYNRVLRMDPVSFQITGHLFENVATDYRSMAVRPSTAATPLIVIGASGTGNVLVADGASLALLDKVDMVTSYPTATPQDVAIVNDPATRLPAKLYVLDYFRETVRPVLLAGGPPYARGSEIALAWSGQVRVPLSGPVSKADSGEWLFRNVATLGGTPAAPNPVTCNTCHMDGASINTPVHDRQVPAPWRSHASAPYFWDGSVPTIERLVTGAQALHNHTGVAPPPGATSALLKFLSEHLPPKSIYLKQDGTMTADQQAGKVLFEGAAQCVRCHTGPSFIPPAGSPLTIEAGIGTGLVPANVPSLLGAWATAPYLSEGQAKTLMEVLTMNPADAHGQASAGLNPAQLRQLVEYLKTL
ncbi:beta-propeller fold lactonase family protein [Ideonella sp.]|uniref:beta-propeller fold lactonase family protein n=1 Tax=Ideonella sp. TaxID=1929293 RepID=UPI003BB68372